MVQLADWKLELVEKMEQDAKMSQNRLMESRVAYEREKGVLEVCRCALVVENNTISIISCCPV